MSAYGLYEVLYNSDNTKVRREHDPEVCVLSPVLEDPSTRQRSGRCEDQGETNQETPLCSDFSHQSKSRIWCACRFSLPELQNIRFLDLKLGLIVGFTMGSWLLSLMTSARAEGIIELPNIMAFLGLARSSVAARPGRPGGLAAPTARLARPPAVQRVS